MSSAIRKMVDGDTNSYNICYCSEYPESVKLECIKMLKPCMKSSVSGILSNIFSAPIWCKFKYRKFC